MIRTWRFPEQFSGPLLSEFAKASVHYFMLNWRFLWGNFGTKVGKLSFRTLRNLTISCIFRLKCSRGIGPKIVHDPCSRQNDNTISFTAWTGQSNCKDQGPWWTCIFTRQQHFDRWSAHCSYFVSESGHILDWMFGHQNTNWVYCRSQHQAWYENWCPSRVP